MTTKNDQRPREYDIAVADQILEHMAASGSLLAVCRKPGMPCARTVYRWLEADPEFMSQYARAKAIGLQHFVDETIEIADAPMKDAVAVAQAKLRVEARHWAAERMAPRQFGAKAGLELSGAVEVKAMSAIERRSRMASIMTLAEKRYLAAEAEDAKVIEHVPTGAIDMSDIA